MKNILVAYDGQPPAKRALELAIDLTKKFDGALSVVSVAPLHPPRIPMDPWDDRTAHAEQLLAARQILGEHGVDAEMLEPAGDPAKAIERIAASGHFDTVVVGSRGLNAVSRLLQGSVSEHVAMHTGATVVIAR